MSTLIQQGVLANDASFRTRLWTAMATYALTVLQETPATPPMPQTEALRQQLATSIIKNGYGPPYIYQFAWAVVTNSTLAADISTNIFGISSTTAGPPAVVNTASAHGWSTGQEVEIDNALDTTLNGAWAITVTGGSQFTIPVLGSVASASAGGSVIQMPPDSDINAAVQAVWNAVAGVTNQTV